MCCSRTFELTPYMAVRMSKILLWVCSRVFTHDRNVCTFWDLITCKKAHISQTDFVEVFIYVKQVANGSPESSDSGVDAGDIETLYKVIYFNFHFLVKL